MGNYIRIDKESMVNGPGLRVILWVSGCNWYCEHCHNPESWDPNTGNKITEETIKEIFIELDKPYVQGLTLTGGDPFYKNSREAVLKVLKACKEFYPDKDIWCWTGYNFEDIKDEPAMKYIDVLVDGRFSMTQRIEDLKRKDYSELLKYRGSSNQRVIDVKKSLEENDIILYD